MPIRALTQTIIQIQPIIIHQPQPSCMSHIFVLPFSRRNHYELLLVTNRATATIPSPIAQAAAAMSAVQSSIAPVKPAEFVVFRISQFTAGAAEVSASISSTRT